MKELLGVFDISKMNDKQLDHFAEGIARIANQLGREYEAKAKKQERLKSHGLDSDEAIEKD